MQATCLNPIESKTLELCQAIVDQADFQGLFQSLNAFMQDEGLKYQFQSINDLGSLLQQKQSSGLEVTSHDIAEFESLRERFLGNEVARNFLQAQEEIQKIQSGIHRQLSKTFEIGRVPTPEDFADECCSSGCGCH